MRFLFVLLLIAVSAGLAALLLPWWTIAAIAAILLLIFPLRPGAAFLAGFLGVALAWLAHFFMRDASGHELSGRMATLFPLGGSPWVFMTVAALVGGLAGGMSALTGTLFRRVMSAPSPKKPKRL